MALKFSQQARVWKQKKIFQRVSHTYNNSKFYLREHTEASIGTNKFISRVLGNV